MNGRRGSPLNEIIRLTMGGLTWGLDNLIHPMQREEKTGQIRSDGELERYRPSDNVDQQKSEAFAKRSRYLFLGLAFEIQDRFTKSLDTLDKIAGELIGLSQPVLRPVMKRKIARSISRHFNALVRRGEREVERWIARGQMEDTINQNLVKTTVQSVVQSSVNYVASQEEMQEFVEAQSVSLAGELVEEVRERALSADNYLENLVRLIFRRPLRAKLDQPSSNFIHIVRSYPSSRDHRS